VPNRTAYSRSSHTTARGSCDARVLRSLLIHVARPWYHLAINPQLHTALDRIVNSNYRQLFGPARSRLLHEAPEFLHSPPHQLDPSPVTEMVVTVAGVCQLNTARRILAEIQARINGFNTYG
jgi:hypothetical protein